MFFLGVNMAQQIIATNNKKSDQKRLLKKISLFMRSKYSSLSFAKDQSIETDGQYMLDSIIPREVWIISKEIPKLKLCFSYMAYKEAREQTLSVFHVFGLAQVQGV